MFEYVQERESRSNLVPRTMVYMIMTGETDSQDSEKLSERGENQVLEIALSRVVAGVRRIYSSTSKLAVASSKILSEEFSAKFQKTDCLDDVDIGKKNDPKETLLEMWKDEDFEPSDGESFALAKERIGLCMNELANKHQDDVFAVVTHPLIGFLFYSLVTAAPLDIEGWLNSGNASCASYEYSKKGWSEVLPPDNSYLSDPTTVEDGLPEGYFD
ncbi:MAG: histidine phosphatase family protein [Candidatus Thorarchaeota archaeon]|jgi:broad specificity phosphatase PhoE